MSGDASTPYVGDFYDTLGVSRDATSDQIKKAFRKLARECHPDVAGDSPDAKARFTRVREAYETLVDPIKRATYDRRGRATYHAGPGRFGGKWRPPGGFDFEQVGDPMTGGRAGARRRRRDPGNNIGLEDIFGDFSGSPGSGSDFGFDAAGHQKSNVKINRGSYGGGRPGSSGPVGGGAPGGQAADPRPGRDIQLRVDVPAQVAARGGTVTLRYPRLRRTEDGRGSVRYDEIHDLRVPPGTRHGSTLRVPRMGDAGGGGGSYGDLVCDITVVPGDVQAEQRGRGVRRDPGTGPEPVGDASSAGAAATADATVVAISVVEALLGGRVRVDTPAGPVHITVPPCTDGGTRLRLRGRGQGGTDHYVELRIKTPSRLDAESRALIERFAELNPEEPG